ILPRLILFSLMNSNQPPVHPISVPRPIRDGHFAGGFTNPLCKFGIATFHTILLLAAFCSMMPSRSFAALPGQPFASYWHPSTLLNWNPATDPDAPFNRGSVPLAPRFLNGALNVNSHARTNEAKVVSLVAFAGTSGNPSQGSLSM